MEYFYWYDGTKVNIQPYRTGDMERSYELGSYALVPAVWDAKRITTRQVIMVDSDVERKAFRDLMVRLEEILEGGRLKRGI